MWIYLLTFSRLSIGLVFFASVLGKLRDFSAFQQTIDNFQILPRQAGKLASYALLAGELLTIPLLLGPAAVFGFALSILLLSLFGLVLWISLRRGSQVSCGCFGPSQRPISNLDIGRNIGLIFVSLLGMVSLSITPGIRIQPRIEEHFLTGMISIVLTLLWINLSALVGFFKSAGSSEY
jgi:hypothetical protein